MSDRWADWLLSRRFAGSEDVRREFMKHLTQVREKVLDNAELASGGVLLDVGCGEGLIAFAGLERGAGSVIFCDISEDLLNESRTIATDLGTLDRCRFVVQAAAEDLGPIASSSVDVVTTRSVLIYVKDKQRAFTEFFFVLETGRPHLPVRTDQPPLQLLHHLRRHAGPGPGGSCARQVRARPAAQ